MRPFVIDLNDRAVAFARDGQVLSLAPSAVWDGSTGELPGSNAWGALRRHPTATSTRHLGMLLAQPTATDRTVALVAAEWVNRLTAQSPTPSEKVWIATPAHASTQGLRASLAIARKLTLPVDGFVDAAVASVAALGLEQTTIVLEVGLHHAAATYIDRDGTQVRRRRTVVTERGGLMSFYQGWLELVSTTLVKRTRFDPLHDAVTEQQLVDSLAACAAEAALHGSAPAVVTKGTERFEVALTRDQFAQAGQSLHREIIRLLHELRPAGAALALVVPSLVERLPGLKEELEQFTGCELLSLPDGFAAQVVSQLDLPGREPEQPVRLLRRLPVNPQGAEVSRTRLGADREARAQPSHLLLNGQVYALGGGDPLVIGRMPTGPRTIALSEGLAGVSRRHCTLTPEGNEIVLVDHSSFGTYVNGERVAERVRVCAGDRVRIGDPGVELAPISVSDAE
jgi:FHA domain-containing protein